MLCSQIHLNVLIWFQIYSECFCLASYNLMIAPHCSFKTWAFQRAEKHLKQMLKKKVEGKSFSSNLKKIFIVSYIIFAVISLINLLAEEKVFAYLLGCWGEMMKSKENFLAKTQNLKRANSFWGRACKRLFDYFTNIFFNVSIFYKYFNTINVWIPF